MLGAEACETVSLASQNLRVALFERSDSIKCPTPLTAHHLNSRVAANTASVDYTYYICRTRLRANGRQHQSNGSDAGPLASIKLTLQKDSILITRQ